jgi:hypothetical protein
MRKLRFCKAPRTSESAPPRAFQSKRHDYILSHLTFQGYTRVPERWLLVHSRLHLVSAAALALARPRIRHLRQHVTFDRACSGRRSVDYHHQSVVTRAGIEHRRRL